MTRRGKPSKKGRASGGSKGTPKGRSSSSGGPTPEKNYSGSNNGHATMRFTLRDAARNTGHTHSFWDATNKLRFKGIDFVSAGTTGSSFDAPLDEDGTRREDDNPPSPDLEIPVKNTAADVPERLNGSVEVAMDNVHLDSSTTPVYRTQTPSPALSSHDSSIRSPSPTPSNSSEEVVIFSGRRPKFAQDQTTAPAEKLTSIVSNTDGETAKTIKSDQSTIKARSPTRPQEDVPTRSYNVTFNRVNPTESSSDRLRAERADPSSRPPIRSEPKMPSEPILYHAQPRQHCPEGNSEDAEEVIEELLEDVHMQVSDDGMEPQIPQKNKRKHRSGKAKRNRNKKKKTAIIDGQDDIPDDIMDDYIANTKANGTFENLWQDTEYGLDQELGEWGPAELEDFADLSTSEEVLETITHVLSRRERSSGLQYLIVWEGQSVDEARWIHETPLQAVENGKRLIHKYEELRRAQEWQQALAAEQGDSSAEEGDEKVIVGSDANNEDNDDEDNDSEAIEEEEDNDYDTDDLPPSDEEDLIRRRRERMTDEHIARLLQKQEELGYGGEDVILFDEYDDGEGDTEDNIDQTDPFDLTTPNRKFGRNASKKSRNRRSLARNSSLDVGLNDQLYGGGVADYGNFDVMDWKRPSLQQAKQNVAAFGLSDSELERGLAESWAIDRSKKKQKKQEREELRAQGLFGGGSGKKRSQKALKAKGGALSMSEFEDELETFLGASEKKQLALPPMDKKTRKVVHEIGHAFGLKSKSIGTGKDRFPTLYKTARTKRFDAYRFDLLEERLSRRFGLGPALGKPGRMKKKGVDGFNVSEGQLVGAGASEIGSENKGRTMLEKMGWSKGMGLGTEENKGILMPVEHVVKKTRAGLG